MAPLSPRPAQVLAALLSMLPGLHGLPGDRPGDSGFVTRSEALGRHGMAATSQPLATLAAVDILRAGGSAVDAAIAANAVLCVTEPTGCGLGGDLFAIVWHEGTKDLHGYNGSGRSPAGLSLDELQRRGITRMPKHGPLPLSVPGCVDAWFALHERFGKLEMQALLAPAIRVAREGFPVTEVIAEGWRRNVPALLPFPGFEQQLTIDGRAPKAGETFANPNLARTLELLAEKGRGEFYRGSIARAIGDYVRAQGGFLAYEDLAAHRGEWVEPLSTRYRGVDVWELPPNGQGLAVLQILDLLEPFDVRAMGFGSAEWLHLFVEAKKVAYEDRARLYADPAFADLPIERLLSKEYTSERRRLVDRTRAAASYPLGCPLPNPALEQGDTVYLCTADAAGNMVSLIQSNYRGMGSGMTPPGLGFVLQDRGELFDLMPGRPNSYAPGKRPFHTIIPGFATRDGQRLLAFGVMGGAVQPQGQVQVLVNLLDFDMGLQEAGDAPRIVHEGSSEPTGETMLDGGTIALEQGFAPEVVAELKRRGHVVGDAPGGFGGYQAILWDGASGTYRGASESRKDGCALGY